MEPSKLCFRKTSHSTFIIHLRKAITYVYLCDQCMFQLVLANYPNFDEQLTNQQHGCHQKKDAISKIRDGRAFCYYQ